MAKLVWAILSVLENCQHPVIFTMDFPEQSNDLSAINETSTALHTPLTIQDPQPQSSAFLNVDIDKELNDNPLMQALREESKREVYELLATGKVQENCYACTPNRSYLMPSRRKGPVVLAHHLVLNTLN